MRETERTGMIDHAAWKLILRLFDNENLSIFITIFKNRLFLAFMLKNRHFRDQFLVGRFGPGQVADWLKCEKVVAEFEQKKKTLKPSSHQISSGRMILS